MSASVISPVNPSSSADALASRPRALIDSFNRRIDYLRVSITDRCDLRCQYCLPEDFKGFEEPANWLTHDEMARLIGLFVGFGVAKIRLTGGEPLTRRGVSELATKIAALDGVTDLAISTNGTRLARHAAELRQAGVRRLNVSLDTLDAATFKEITRRDRLQDVLDGLDTAHRVGFDSIKINCVVHSQSNEEDIARLLDFTMAKGFILRLIETMPMGDSGRQYKHVNLNEMGARLGERYGLVATVEHRGPGPARYWATRDNIPALGLITPMSQHFCASCNRVRLSVDGTLYLCLGQENQISLGTALRKGATDDELRQLILAGIAAKPERHEFTTAPERVIRVMAKTGG
ncbi:GTP 3',8-cyclase MoaA [Achromobacter sp. F4_2707]|uniref:GTP 3',8-cyclase MoaA n=1 Tax=Achromobacter sp. F4_2707 TaxID=3114286 RepID=UPI0039C627CA